MMFIMKVVTSFEEDRGDGQPPGEFEMSAYRTLLRVPSVTRIPLYEEERQEAAKQQGTVLHYAAKILDDARGKDDHKARGGEAIEFGYSQDAISNIFDTIQQENMPLESTVARASGR